MGFPQSRYAYADMEHPEPFAFCDRCGFRYLRKDFVEQRDWRGTSLASLHILVCTRTCEDLPQEQEKTILIGPDPIPVRDPRPGWQTTQAGFGGVSDILELVDGDILPPVAGGLGNNNGVLYLTNPSGWPTSDLLVPAGGFWSNGGETEIAAGAFSILSAAPLIFGSISASQLLTYNAGYLRQTAPPVGSGILWNPWGTDGGPIFVA